MELLSQFIQSQIQPSIQDYLTSLIVFTALSLVVLPLIPALFSIASFLETLPTRIKQQRLSQEVQLLLEQDYHSLLKCAKQLPITLHSRKKSDVVHAIALYNLSWTASLTPP